MATLSPAAYNLRKVQRLPELWSCANEARAFPHPSGVKRYPSLLETAGLK